MEEKRLITKKNFTIAKGILSYYTHKQHIHSAKLIAFGFIHLREERNYTIVFKTSIGDFIRLPYLNDDDMESFYSDGHQMYVDGKFNAQYFCKNAMLFRENIVPTERDEMHIDPYFIDESKIVLFTKFSSPSFPRLEPLQTIF